MEKLIVEVNSRREYETPVANVLGFRSERSLLQTSPRSKNPELDAYDEEDW
ncbi:MAG: hypothetical protein KBT00_07755 [Bacteroidales bacterium]|nr:hypothetical protein [Candidatus Cacconaster merdequi]